METGGKKMDYIIRPKYLKKINQFVDKPVVKILTGMRRVGKSTLLNIIQNEILKGIPRKNKIYINFESLEFFHIKEAASLIQYLSPLLEKIHGKIYFFFDEVQLVEGWEKVINGLRVDRECDIYLTGSNSTLLSGDLATLLAGRYVEFEIQAFNFSEFIEIFKYTNLEKEELFTKFLKLGGMPFLRYFNLEEESSYKYLTDVYNTIIVKDILEYNKIRDIDVFNRILLYVIENIGHTFSANSIKKYFKNENRDISLDTILNYLEYCKRAFIIKKVPRYDSIGKKILKIDEKYYVSDHGFRAAKGFSNEKDIERVLENIVYIELLTRGYNIEIGKVKEKEIDFIAKKEGNIEYYQVSYMMTTEETRKREFSVYSCIKDNFPKYVLSMDNINFTQNGIIHKNIIDFLLEDKK